jgi:RNA polymerase sigma-70 factor, ECF subfamily
MLDKNDIRLVAALKNGEQRAFQDLVQKYQVRIYNLALNFVKDSEEAKDITQDVFVKIFRSIDRLNDPAKFYSWLYQIALNHCRNRYNQMQRKGFFNSFSFDDMNESISLADNESPEKVFEQKKSDGIVRDCIASLKESEREIIILRDLQELSYEEISNILSLPKGTVKSKLNRARLSLKNKLKKFL